ncbi:MAG: hypothetical protein HN542_11775 [Flavobacteriales bacterium]|jgi:peptidoglycan/LPS O-acetylase OafA/YrhL|nr:hypothetical protein [Flavobacteriales bacterium]NCG28927.1 hypothetical protein [Bacteroidota bacterium]MBT3963827.1 hypothetical protein [Flavobacteriales bacterium]MBT4704666.1 hypothetical protein [Flavobacteriales bacterium]MBT4931751.1 hypothetical protein [Flavobacteriales bacterium]
MYGALLAYFLKWKEALFYQIFSSPIAKYLIIIGLLLSYSWVLISPNSHFYVWVFFRTLFEIFCAGLSGLTVIGFKGGIGRILENRWLLRGGVLSYAIYLLHNFVPGILMGIKKLELPLFFNLLVYFIVTIILSELVHRLVERPVRKMGDRFRLELTKESSPPK